MLSVFVYANLSRSPAFFSQCLFYLCSLFIQALAITLAIDVSKSPWHTKDERSGIFLSPDPRAPLTYVYSCYVRDSFISVCFVFHFYLLSLPSPLV
ncbi:uncharacterized protein EDB91DRAFT_222298 [Suillus paluster]|uniref:uncharacterized protein n=1 Tax=Suillus paluster TaxID=48578 RepID=UPI001B86E525|nr:uncharacterized protein EDB91DRAFT_222298 [Suillus paluster]KAG1743697.1 hypothetical protein EDB91DRAFT_222298 [Suillus paluster]